MTLEEGAGLVAAIATMVAAMMTAANLGARVTGWGFVVFTLGSVCWSTVGILSGQSDLMATNLFLTLVNLLGIWRWLGRQRSYEEGARSAQQASRRSSVPSLFTATGIAGMPVHDHHDLRLGKAVEALVECSTGRISYVVVASGGVGGIDEQLRAVPHDQIRFEPDHLRIMMARREFEGLVILEDGAWPAGVRSGASAAST